MVITIEENINTRKLYLCGYNYRRKHKYTKVIFMWLELIEENINTRKLYLCGYNYRRKHKYTKVIFMWLEL